MGASFEIIDVKKYGKLLARVHPSVIESEEENERILSEVEKLMDRGEARTPEEDKLLELLIKLVDDFEKAHYPIADAAPHEVLLELMIQHGLRQRDLVPLLGSSSGTASEVVNGKRAISRAQAKALADYFHVSPELFFR